MIATCKDLELWRDYNLSNWVIIICHKHMMLCYIKSIHCIGPIKLDVFLLVTEMCCLSHLKLSLSLLKYICYA